MAFKCHFWENKSGFWGRVVSLTPPHPISQMPDAKKHVFKIIGARKKVFQGLFDLKKDIMCQKMA